MEVARLVAPHKSSGFKRAEESQGSARGEISEARALGETQAAAFADEREQGQRSLDCAGR